MSQFVHQRRLLHPRWRPIGKEQLFLVVIVKGGRLLRQEIDSRLLQVEIRRDEAEFFQRDLFGANLFGLDCFLYSFLQKLVDFVPRDQIVADGLFSLQA